MKKLLLVSLLAMGATSFAAVHGTATEATVGIQVKGRVYKPAGELVVTPDASITPDGRVMAFDLGDIPTNTTSKVFNGGFKIERLTAGTNPTDAPVQNELISTTQTLEVALAKYTQDITAGANKVATVIYDLGFTNLDGANATDAALKVATGNIGVSAIADSTPGNIIDVNELKVVVK